MKAFVGLVFAGLVIWGTVHFFISGWHHQVGEGKHTGYVTAVERSGVFFKTMRVYVKTDTQSSQEDAYCVVDPVLYEQLSALSQQKVHVTVGYISWLLDGVAYCNEEGDVITSVQVEQ